MGKTWKVILCGASFGQFYMEALHRLSDRFEVVGLYAKGSERSIKCAEQYSVPLYTDLEKLPAEIDFAVVIMRSGILGGIGNDIVKYFLNKRIHVIQEFPIHPDDVDMHYKLGKKNKVNFYIGNFYLQLPQIKKFAEIASKLNEICMPRHIQMSFATQLSFPAIMMLREFLPAVRELELKCVTQNETPFQVLIGAVGDVTLTIEVHNESNLKDPDSNMYLLQSFTLIYETGRLCIQDPFGPIYWYPKIKTSTKLYESGAIARIREEQEEKEVAMELGNYKPVPFEKIKSEVWVKAIEQDLVQAVLGVEDKKAYIKKAQKDIIGTKQWNEVNKLIGFPKNVTDSETTEDIWNKVLNIVKSMR